MTPDLAARKILVAAYIYYVLDDNVMTDDEYDQLSIYVADNWAELHPTRQFCCGDPESTKASGSHFKFTVLCVSAARRLLELERRPTAQAFPTTRWIYDFEHGRYRTAS